MKPPSEIVAGYVFMFVGGILGLFSILLGLTYPYKTYDTECIALFLFTYGLYLLWRF
jgi:uncharacterized protein with PQ loop repeat